MKAHGEQNGIFIQSKTLRERLPCAWREGEARRRCVEHRGPLVPRFLHELFGILMLRCISSIVLEEPAFPQALLAGLVAWDTVILKQGLCYT